MFSPLKTVMPNDTCCFSGHRNIPREIQKEIIDKTADVIRELYSRGVRVFKSGGALGFDTIAAVLVLAMKCQLPDIRLELELIAESQPNGWSEDEKRLYYSVLERADAVRYASPVYSRGAIFARNRNLVDKSSYCICYLTKKSGGTAYTVDYARKQGLEITNIAK